MLISWEHQGSDLLLWFLAPLIHGIEHWKMTTPGVGQTKHSRARRIVNLPFHPRYNRGRVEYPHALQMRARGGEYLLNTLLNIHVRPIGHTNA